MTIWRLVSGEIHLHRLNFMLGMLSVAVAVGAVVTALIVLGAHDASTDRLMAAMEEEADGRLNAMENDYRKYMKELGFNLLILPEQQDLAEFWTKGYATHSMPEDHVTTLANSATTNIRHLLPIIQQELLWPEQKRTVILIGTRGEVPLAHRKPKEPLLLAVPKGKTVVGYRLAEDLDLKVGGSITLLGETFEVAKTQPERGTAEDVTLWIHLAAAQRLLDMPGRINGIEALKCFCVGVGVKELREEVAGILPGTNVILRQNKVTVRQQARTRAEEEHKNALAAEKARRSKLRQSRESLAAVLVPVIVLAAALWIGLLAFGNVRERIPEIGILRALGVGTNRVFLLFQSRAVLIGLCGAVLGCLGGIAIGVVLATRLETSLSTADAARLVSPLLIVALAVAAPLLSVAASWVPSMLAARQDPAIVLSHE